jgi:signal peptidase II
MTSKEGKEKPVTRMNQDSASQSRLAGRRSLLVIGYWSLVIFLYGLDQLTKRLIMANLTPFDSHPVIPGFFDLVYVTNTGAAFGSFRNSNPFFITVSTITLLVLLVLQLRGMFRDRLSRTGVALLMAGILGNLTDRLLLNHVIDFLSFDLHIPFANPWPSFNVADSCICVAVGLFLIGSILEERKGKAKARG